MLPDQLRVALEERFADLSEYTHWARSKGFYVHTSEGWKTDKQCLHGNITRQIDDADTSPERLARLCRALGFPTPDEQHTHIAERSATAAERAAIASEQSAKHARSSKLAAWTAALIAAMALLFSLTEWKARDVLEWLSHISSQP